MSRIALDTGMGVLVGMAFLVGRLVSSGVFAMEAKVLLNITLKNLYVKS